MQRVPRAVGAAVAAGHVQLVCRRVISTNASPQPLPPPPPPRQSSPRPLSWLSVTVGAAVGCTATLLSMKLGLLPAPPTAEETAAAVITGGSLPSRPYLRVSDSFVAAWDARTRNPAWVAERLTAEALDGGGRVARPSAGFREDTAVPAALRAERSDWLGAAARGWERGHLAPAADQRGERAMADSFLFSNISPQNGPLNRGYWARLEAWARSLVTEHATVHVVSGPLFLPRWHPSAGGELRLKDR